MANADQLIAAYRKARALKEELADKHKQEMAPYNNMLAKLEAGLLRELANQGLESFKGVNGTAYKRTFTNVKTSDWDLTLPWVLKNGLTHMLEKKLNKSSVQEYVQANEEVPPGITITEDIVIGVRAPTKK
jgi:hypothetical protein